MSPTIEATGIVAFPAHAGSFATRLDLVLSTDIAITAMVIFKGKKIPFFQQVGALS